MIPTKAVKSTALMTLKGKWGNSIVTAIIPFCAFLIVYIAVSLLDLPMGDFSVIIGIALYVLTVAPLLNGAVRCYWYMANSCESSPMDVFYYFTSLKYYKKALTFNFFITLRLLIVSLIFLSPSYIVSAITNEAFFEFIGVATPIWVLSLEIIVYAVRFVGFVAIIAYAISLYLPAFLFVCDEEMKPRDCIKRGIEIGKYTVNRFASHLLGFVGWMFISMLIVPLVFTAPYLIMSYVVDCRYSIAYYNRFGYRMQGALTHEV